MNSETADPNATNSPDALSAVRWSDLLACAKWLRRKAKKRRNSVKSIECPYAGCSAAARKKEADKWEAWAIVCEKAAQANGPDQRPATNTL